MRMVAGCMDRMIQDDCGEEELDSYGGKHGVCVLYEKKMVAARGVEEVSWYADDERVTWIQKWKIVPR